jgi:flagellar basal body-associated protein FliL
MSEETNVTESNEGGWSGLKKTIIGTVGTVVAAGGMWVSSHLFGGESDQKEAPKTEQAAAPVIVNLNNNNTQEQKAGGTTTIIKEKVVEKQAAPAEKKEEKKKSETEDAPW